MSFKDEDVPFLSESEALRSEPRGFAPDQMVRCEACLRANPPTRTSCLYCAAQLPATETSAVLQRPTLRRLEKWELGFNVILVPDSAAHPSEEALQEAAEFLRFTKQDFKRIIEAREALPVARAATFNEASLVERKLIELGLKTLLIPDSDMEPDDSAPKRVRALELMESELLAHSAGGGEGWRASWSDITLLVAGRIFVREIEVVERKGRRAENEIVDAREMSADEAVLDIYTAQSDRGWRISAGSFDFSCLGARKGLVAAQNFSTLMEVLRLRASNAIYDDSYNRVRNHLSAVWPLEQHTEPRGWHRKRPGHVSTEAVTRSDNESQFTRYSRLRHYLQQHPLESSE